MAVLGICTVTGLEGAGSGFRLYIRVAATNGSGQTHDCVSAGEAIQGNLPVSAINDIAIETAKTCLQSNNVIFGPGDTVQII